MEARRSPRFHLLFGGPGGGTAYFQTGGPTAIAASLLAAQGIEARPVLDGGVEDWEERGGRTIEFRRCGS